MAHNALARLFRAKHGLQQTLGPLRQTRSQSTKAVPAFSPTSSLELDQQLNRIREELFVPMYLAEKQKRLSFRQRYHDRLNHEQVRVTIGDEEFTLRPRNRQSLPTKGDIKRAIEAMKTSQDWKNFIPLLIGARHSNFIFKEPSFEKWVRLAGRNGTIGFILESAKQSERTGLSLSSRDLALELAFSLHERAAAAGFKGEETAIALRHAEQTAQLMEWREHTNSDVTQDPKRQPFFIGLLLELNAARVLDESNGEDIHGRVLSYTEKLLATWPQAALDRELTVWPQRDQLLRETVMMYSGLKMSLSVKSVSTNNALQQTIASRLKELKKVILDQLNHNTSKTVGHPTRGTSAAQALLSE